MMKLFMLVDVVWKKEVLMKNNETLSEEINRIENAVLTVDKLKSISVEQKEVEKKHGEELLKKALSVRKIITDKHGESIPENDVRGNMKCPLCNDGNRTYGISSWNGHIHSVCSTEDCIQWCE